MSTRSKERQRTPARVPDRVLTLKQWAELNALSLRTARRLVAGSDGPPVVQLTNRRIGVRESDTAKWQAARLRGQSA
jgi:predicted DNA-binding transcriptional regulator AlpA